MAQRYSQKYTVVCLFHPEAKFTNFSADNWPLHVTILDTFKTEWQLNALCNALEKVAADIAPFEAVPIRKELLGEAKDVPVKLLRLDEPMSVLHNELMKLVTPGTFVFNTPEFVGNGFLPHATDHVDNHIEISKLYRLENISLVDMFPAKDHMRREVVDTFSFEPVSISGLQGKSFKKLRVLK